MKEVIPMFYLLVQSEVSPLYTLFD